MGLGYSTNAKSVLEVTQMLSAGSAAGKSTPHPMHLRLTPGRAFRSLMPKVLSAFIAICRLRDWVAVKELKLSYYIGETLLFTIYTHYGNLI